MILMPPNPSSRNIVSLRGEEKLACPSVAESAGEWEENFYNPMGSIITINDTLQLTREQGFPVELNFERHLKTPYKTEDFSGKVFEFRNKPEIRIYKVPPVRNFLVENRNGKWIYWGLVHILEIVHDYANKTTGGKFKIIYIYSPDEMKKAHELIDRNDKTKFFD